MVKRIVAVALLFSLFSFRAFALDEPNVSAASAALIVADTGELVFGKNEHEKRSMASTTKIMTALLTLRLADSDEEITVSREMAAVEGSSMGLLPSDKVTYHDLVYGMLLASGNDAANTAAISIAGSTEKFAELMNKTAAEIGMENTNFVTPSGLDAENHYSTAFDMALLGREAIQNPDFLAACSSAQAKLCYGNEPYTRYLSNHNRLLKSFDGAVGIKTGFTKKSGRCLVSAAERNGVMLVCTTLNAPNDWEDHRKLLEYGFALVEKREISSKSVEIDVFGGTKPTVGAETQGSVQISSLCSADSFETEIIAKPYLVAPVEKGEVLGEIRIKLNGKTVKSVELLAAEDIAKTTAEVFKKPRLSERIKNWFIKLFNSLKER